MEVEATERTDSYQLHCAIELSQPLPSSTRGEFPRHRRTGTPDRTERETQTSLSCPFKGAMQSQV